MDIRRTILWVVFSISLLLLWNQWKATQETSVTKTEVAQATSVSPNLGSSDATSTVPSAPSARTPQVTETTEATASAGSSSNATFTLKSDVLNLKIDALGGQIITAELLKHTDSKNSDTNIQLLHNTNNQSQYIVQSGLTSNTSKLPNHESLYTLRAKKAGCNPCEVVVNNQKTHQLTLVYENDDVYVEKVFTLKEGSYNVDVTYHVTNRSTQNLQPSVYYQIVRDSSTPPGESFFYSTFTGPVVYSEEEKYEKISFSDITKSKAEFVKDTNNGWIGMVQHYFAVAWVPKQGVSRVNGMATDASNTLYRVFTVLNGIAAIQPNTTASISAQLWIGPQDQEAMAEVAPGLPLVVNYGWLTFIAKYLFKLMTFIYPFVQNWGWTIVILTIILKALFYPLSAASYRSMAKMKKLAPRLATLKERYGDDKLKLNQEMMAMYKEEKINPLGGCLPMVLQIPVFISLYWVILASVEIRNAPWVLWIHDLSSPDPWFILPAIMMGTMFLQMRLNPKPTDPTQAKVMMMMPFIFGGMMFFFPAGLVLYWVVNNILSITQQWWVTRKLDK